MGRWLDQLTSDWSSPWRIPIFCHDVGEKSREGVHVAFLADRREHGRMLFLEATRVSRPGRGGDTGAIPRAEAELRSQLSSACCPPILIRFEHRSRLAVRSAE